MMIAPAIAVLSAPPRPAAVAKGDRRDGRGLHGNASQPGNGHHDADVGLIPFLLGQKLDREIGPQPLADIGQKEVQRIQGPLGLLGRNCGHRTTLLFRSIENARFRKRFPPLWITCCDTGL